MTNNWWLLWLALFVVCSDGARLRSMAVASLIPTVIITCLTVLLALFNVIPSYIMMRGEQVRESLGFIHPNSLGFAVLSICTSAATLRFGENPLPSITLLVVGSLFNVLVANSRTSAVICLLEITLLLFFYLVKSPLVRRILSVFFLSGVLASMLLSLLFMITYDPANPFQSSLNQLMSSRLYLSHVSYEIHSLTAFGLNGSTFVELFPTGLPYMLDNGYCHLLLSFGLIPASIFLFGLIALVVNLVKHQQWNLALFGITLMAVYATSETLGIQPDGNFFLIAMGPYLLYPKGSALLQQTIQSAIGRSVVHVPQHMNVYASSQGQQAEE